MPERGTSAARQRRRTGLLGALGSRICPSRARRARARTHVPRLSADSAWLDLKHCLRKEIELKTCFECGLGPGGPSRNLGPTVQYFNLQKGPKDPKMVSRSHSSAVKRQACVVTKRSVLGTIPGVVLGMKSIACLHRGSWPRT